MKRFSLKSKVIAGAAAAVLVAGIGGAAFAFFTSNGSGQGSATVGSATPWTVDNIATTGPDLLPGVGTQTISFKVTNGSEAAQTLNAVHLVIDADVNGDVLDANNANAAVAGCKAVDFVPVDDNSTLPASLAGSTPGPAGVYSGSSTLTLTDSGSSQDACQGVSPAFHVNAS
jgi:hypothetical protein